MRRWLRSARFATAGVRRAWAGQPNLRSECLLAVLTLLLTLWLGVSPVPILLCCGLVLGLELLNTALELLVDLLHPQRHPLAGAVKDVAAGAVLLASFAALLVGAWLLLPPLWQRLFG